ncbi:RNA polymerase sigma-70 factor [Paenibacillus sp. GSMTC-2017]|uniref:RNA polymerase sigma-70 factor n=1 Tax=Paenibacillus sp. GSMTC-2017 TaxID=2794350 RepID=UPI0018D93BE2|nr:RNA polymerase sigma-70 factor [Paenibacillus sp. GSMTC-2017]MBH5318364.1 RNA polymerase sigma-70 factor [Paenibacillus sp. GSMTC-2017]
MQLEMAAAYVSYRPLLMTIAYRMLGSVTDAEDLVQDVFVHAYKWEMDKESSHVLNLKSYLCKMVTNRCLDLLKSARRKREVYVGPWLPEPIVQHDFSNSDQDPLQTIMFEDTISYAFLIMLDRLTPVERAVFILREAFDYDYRDIADTISKTELGCRQIYSRLKRKIQVEPTDPIITEDQTRELVYQFLQAASTGNMEMLLSTLTDDITAYTDGGGKVSAAIRPIQTPSRVAAFILGLASKMDEQTKIILVRINGAIGVILSSPSEPFASVMSFQFKDDRIENIYIMWNPDKLRHLKLG